MKLTEDIKKEIKRHSFLEKPKECCGLIVETEDKKLLIHNGVNLSEDPNHHFSLNPLDYLTASRLGKIVAVYHSHSKGCNFSEADKFSSKSHGIDYVLYCIENNSILHFDPSSEFGNYVGRSFQWMKSDCFSLVKEFYRKELNVDINDYPRGERWKEEHGDLFDKFFEKENFKEVKNLKKYDGILFKAKKDGFSIHCAIYLGDGLMLHQPKNTASRIDEYNDRYKSITNKIVRHASL